MDLVSFAVSAEILGLRENAPDELSLLARGILVYAPLFVRDMIWIAWQNATCDRLPKLRK